MKTNLITKQLEIEYKKYDLDRIHSKLEHYKQFVKILEVQYLKNCQEFEKLKIRNEKR